MPLEFYVLGDVIGKGSYGEVTLAKHKKDKRQYVIKKIDLHNASAKERSFAQQEVEILSKLRHPNIVSYKESFQTNDGCLSIVMGFCEGGDLYARLKKQAKSGEYLSETQVVEWFVQISMALQYIHDRHILHRDLKTQNIFLTKSKIIKLGDLGIARVLDSNTSMATTLIGTPYYMSPELFSNKPYNHKSDVWALGCCVYEMATLKHAFNAKDMNALVYKILKGKIPPMPQHYSLDLQEIIKSMLNSEPSQRPSASRILRHPFIKKHIAIFLEGTKKRRTSRDEKQKKVLSARGSDDSGYSEAPLGVNISLQAIATASKVEIDINNVNENDKKKTVDLFPSSTNDAQDCGSKTELNSQGEKGKHSVRIVSSKKKESRSRISIENPSFPDEERKQKNRKMISKKVDNCSSVDKHKGENIDFVNDDKEKFKTEKTDCNNCSQPSHVRKVLQQRVQARMRQQDQEKHKKKDDSKLQAREKQTNKKNKRDEISNEKSSQETSTENMRMPARPLPQLPTDRRKGEQVDRQRLPPPRFKSDLPVNKDLPSTNGKYQEKEPQCSAGMPNMAARRKRRQKLQERESQISSPSLPKHSSEISLSALSYSSYTPRSHEDIIREHKQRKSVITNERDSVDGSRRSRCEEVYRQSSERPWSGKSQTDASDVDDVEATEKKNDESNLIEKLQATLNLKEFQPDQNKPSGKHFDNPENDISPSATGRLLLRIKKLRDECINGLGEVNLKKAYTIIDAVPEDKVEATLIDLLGKENFDLYSGPIWQLKFCEEFKL